MWLLIVWLVVQMLVLVGQDTIGPLFFVPRAWREREAQWDWHPTPEALHRLLRDADDVEVPAVRDARDMPLGDCPVCLAPNSWDAEETDDAEDAHLLGGVLAALDRCAACDGDATLVAEELRHAAYLVGQITGETLGADEVLGAIFARFCIGK